MLLKRDQPIDLIARKGILIDITFRKSLLKSLFRSFCGRNLISLILFIRGPYQDEVEATDCRVSEVAFLSRAACLGRNASAPIRHSAVKPGVGRNQQRLHSAR